MGATVGLEDPGVREALARSSEWRLLGLFFERPRPGTRQGLDTLLLEVGDPALGAVAEGLRGMDEGEYLRYLGPGGPVSPREVAYRWHDDPGWTLADLSAFYAAFGYAPQAEDPPDHVAVETGFVAYLWLKEAYLRVRGEGTEVTSEARGRFIASHLSTLAAGLVSRLEPLQAPGFLALAHALVQRTGPPAQRPGPRAGTEDETPLDCGSCPAG